MDTKSIVILFLVMMVILLGILLDFDNNKSQELSETIDKVKQLEKINRQLNADNKLLDQELNKLRKSSDSLTMLTEIRRNEIAVIKQIENENIETINNYTILELFEFFSKLSDNLQTTNQSNSNTTKDKQ